jgi:hypothetical protein
MNITLYSRAAPSDRLRVWVGAFQTTQAPVLSWLLNGVPTNPNTLRPMSSVRSANLLPDGVSPATLRRTFTGVYEFTGLLADTPHKIKLTADGAELPLLETRTLPDSVPVQLDRSFNVLLVSCFHQAEDRGGLAGTIVSQLKATSKPHLTLLAGDQVYLDLPTLKDFPDDEKWLAKKFEEDYSLNWNGPLAYTQVLGAAPCISVPDDHEYWNNYPHPSPFIANSRTKAGQDHWREAAQAVYEGFQLAYPDGLGQPVTLDVRPLSFFFADTRSNKNIDRAFTMTDDARQKLSDWAKYVADNKMFGVFVSGQSLFSKPATNLTGKVGDYELPNYNDYGSIMQALKGIVDRGRPVICLTGDVHWGRVVTSKDIQSGRTAFAEVISSPASLVTTIGADQLKEIGGAIGGLFGKKNPWPRHSDPAAPPAFLASDALQGRFPCTMVHGQRGNHVVLLQFRQQGGGLELRIKYWPISIDSKIGKPTELGPLDLVSA